MKKLASYIGACVLLVWGVANAADGQAIAKAKAACQANPTQCAQEKIKAKADAQKEAQAAKQACAKNQSACENAKAKAKSAIK